MQLGLVKEGLVAALGLAPVVVLLDQALINLPDGLLSGRLLKDGAPQVQVVCGYHLHKASACLHKLYPMVSVMSNNCDNRL